MALGTHDDIHSHTPLHETGAAIATMDAILLKQDLDSSVTITTSVFGLPRGGNQAWADFVDSKVCFPTQIPLYPTYI